LKIVKGAVAFSSESALLPGGPVEKVAEWGPLPPFDAALFLLGSLSIITLPGARIHEPPCLDSPRHHPIPALALGAKGRELVFAP